MLPRIINQAKSKWLCATKIVALILPESWFCATGIFIYIHALETVEKESANIFNNIFSGSQSGSQKQKMRLVE